MTTPRKILLATDFSPYSERALEVAIEYAKQFGAELHVTHVFSLPIPLLSPYEVSVPDPYIEETRAAAEKKLAAAVAKASAAGLRAESHLTEGPAATAIADTAADVGADLLVLGTRGLTGLKHIVLGSVAGHVLRLAPCSVLAVKQPEED